MFEKKSLSVAVGFGLLLLLVSVQYTTFGSGADYDHAAGFISSGIADDNHNVFLPVVINSDIEHIALMALYNSTNGPNWSNNDGWGVGAPCPSAATPWRASWYGVSRCDSGHVQRLFLASNQLSGAIPAELGNLSRLSWLRLDSNQLSGSIPAELGKLWKLGDLWLQVNQLSGAIPAELGNLSSLKTLKLERNQLSGAIPPELGNLSSLSWLDLSENQLSGPIPAELGNLSSLSWLHLNGNNLSGPIPAELGNLSSLSWLHLNGNNLSGPIPAALANMTSLSMLRLQNNPDLRCWQTEEALNWARGLAIYFGPDAVCQPEPVYPPVVVSAGG